MKLTASPTSPFVRKVRVLIREAGRTADIEEVFLTTTPFATDSRAKDANPLGKIPALIREDGHSIYDSRVICRYLDSVWGLGLYPEDKLWEVLTLEATADAIFEAAVSMVYERRFRPEQYQFADWIEAQWQKIDRTLTALEAQWVPHLEGPFTMAHIGIGCALSYVDFRAGDRNWRANRPQLARWHESFAARPSMTGTEPE